MRRYKIQVGNDTFDSAPGGQSNPNALQVELDVQVTTPDAPQNGAYVTIWGLGLEAISQTRNYYGKSIEIHGGMAKGLPLAKPQQFGLLAKGIVTQAYGEWKGVNQSLTLVFAPGGAPLCSGGPNPMPPKKNLVLNWKKGKPLNDALKSALETGYPGWEVAMNITKQLIADQDQVSYHPNLQQLAYHVRRLTQMMEGKDYPGVSIDNTQGRFNVFDINQKSSTIAFEDLVGMPTWIGPQTIQVTTIMRGDITIDKKITLPQTFVNSSQSGAPVGSWFDQRMSFTGDWSINSIRHVGNSRAPTGDAWVSIFECYSNALSQSQSQNDDCKQEQGGD